MNVILRDPEYIKQEIKVDELQKDTDDEWDEGNYELIYDPYSYIRSVNLYEFMVYDIMFEEIVVNHQTYNIKVFQKTRLV